MALSRQARAYIEKVAAERAERKRVRMEALQRRAERKRQAEEARLAEEARIAAEQEAERIAAGRPAPEPPPKPERQFPVPYWLSSPNSPYYTPDLVENENARIEWWLPDRTLHWASHPGPQTYALYCPFGEVLVGGRRGGGKSRCLIAKPAMGDPTLPPDDPARHSFLNDRAFRGLFLREEYQSMAEFIEEAVEFFKPFQGEVKGDPKYIQFKSGARIYFNHLQDEKAFEKYKGWNLTFIGIEELTQIRTLKQYLKLLGSLRSAPRVRVVAGPDGRAIKKTFPALRTQIFSSSNPDGPGACLPFGEVLTDRGWRDIADIRVGEKVWSVNPSDGKMVLSSVDQTHSSHFSGELYQAQGRGLFLSCTPNHKILRFNTTKHARHNLVLEAIEKFPGQATIVRTATWEGDQTPWAITARSSKRKRRPKWVQPISLAPENYASLVGWMVTEGSVVKRDNALSIAQLKSEGRKELKELLDRCGFRQNWNSKGVLVYSHEWCEHFSWLPHTHEKYVPQSVKDMSPRCLECLMNAMVSGDGTRESSTSGYFFSSSARLASDFCEIALKCGYMVYAGGRQREDSGGLIKGRKIASRAYAHEVSFHKQKVGGSELRTGNHTYSVETTTARLNVRRVEHNGPVYCIGVRDTHTFVVRQNGCVWISGNSWVKDRFVKVIGPNGREIPWGTPMEDTIMQAHRIFIPFPIEANPVYAPTTAQGRQYHSYLMAQDEVTRKQWLEGDWDAGSSLFFTEYRPDGPVGEEETRRFPWAHHRTKRCVLQPWWYRWGGGDHGFDHPAAYHKACRNEVDHRVHIYDEMTMRHVGAFEQGARLAQWWLPELQALQKAGQTPCIVIHLGADAFSKTDIEKTIAEQMQAGIREVLGPYGGILLKYDEVEREMMLRDRKRAQQMFDRRISELQGRMALALKPCYIDRIAAWDYFREMLRFRPAVLNLHSDEEREEYLKQVLKEQGREAYEFQAEKIRNLKPEILPKIKIWESCSGLDRCLKVAQKDMRNEDDPTKMSKSGDVLKFNSDSEGLNGDDELDSARNAIVAYKEIETTMPLSYFVNEKMAQAQEDHVKNFGAELTDNTRLMMIAQNQAAWYAEANRRSMGFTLPRSSSQRHRVN